MSSLNRPARLNRSLLTVIGIVLLAASAFVLTAHFGRLTLVRPDAALIPRLATPATWTLYLTAAVAVILGLLMLRWLLAQLARTPRSRVWRFESDPEHGRTELAATTAITPFTEELATYPGVHAAHATLAGTRDAPRLALIVSAEQDGDLTEIRHQLDTEGLPRLRQALDLTDLPVTIEFRFATQAGRRIR